MLRASTTGASLSSVASTHAGRVRCVPVNVSVCTDMIAPHVNLRSREPAKSGKFYATRKVVNASDRFELRLRVQSNAIVALHVRSIRYGPTLKNIQSVGARRQRQRRKNQITRNRTAY